MRKFIRENREAIDKYIKSVCRNCPLNDESRRDWIMNDESLYDWARSSGVKNI